MPAGCRSPHHNALADARACGQVCSALTHRAVAEGRESAFQIALQLGGGRTAATLPTTATDADPNHPLYGSRVVFTGSLDSMTRNQARDLLAAVGGAPQQGVNRQTTIIVIGPDHYQGQVLTGEAMTTKMRKAAGLRAKGQPIEIEIMSEDDFLRCL